MPQILGIDHAKPNSEYLAIHGAAGPLVTIHLATGQITYGPNYTPDAAAKAFWEALAGVAKVGAGSH